MHGIQLVNFPLLALIPLLPLIGAAYTGLFGARLSKRYGEKVIAWPAILLPWGSCVIALVALVNLIGLEHGAMLHHTAWTWMATGWLNVDLALQFDRLSAVMTLIVTFVGSLIHVYSVGYMRGDPSFWRFFSNLNLFMFSMLVLVLGDNFLVMFIGWEGVGLCSYLLIGFWYREKANAVAGMKAFVVNRIGDFGFSLGVFLLFWGLAAFPALPGSTAETTPQEAAAAATASAHGDSAAEDTTYHPKTTPVTSVTFREVESILQDPVRREGILNQKVLGIGMLTLICLLLFVGATGKSAQIPLYVWLPDAMAGPTPVSALIHAATMVTAGVYMVARTHFLFAASPAAMTVVATVGAITALFAATIGLFQYDIKKVLAYSTVSQLGFMFLAVGVGAYWVAIFHLMTHAFFKACLFLGSGSVILGCHHEQDMRKMGGLRKLMPITAVTYFLSACAIAGFPFFSGFFSKDEILWKAFDSGNMLLPGGGVALWALAAIAALFTSFYMFRSYYMTFSGEYRGGHAHDDPGHDDAGHDDAHGHDDHAHVPHESPASMTSVLVVLGALAVVGGYIGLPHLWHLPNFFEHWLEPVFAGSAPLVTSAHYSHGLEWGLMGLSIAIAFTGFFVARALYRNTFGAETAAGRLLASPSPLVQRVHRVIFNKYYVDEVYQATIIDGSVKLSRTLSLFDSYVVDGVVNLCGGIGRVFGMINGAIDKYFVDGLVNLVGGIAAFVGRRLRTLQTGRIQTYVFGLTTGAVLLVVLGYVFIR